MMNNILNPFQLYTIPLDDWINQSINFIVDNFRPFFQAIGFPISWTLKNIEWVFLAIPPLIFIIIVGLIAWKLAGRKITIYSIISLTLIGFVDIWEQAMVSLALVVTAVVFCPNGNPAIPPTLTESRLILCFNSLVQQLCDITEAKPCSSASRQILRISSRTVSDFRIVWSINEARSSL